MHALTKLLLESSTTPMAASVCKELLNMGMDWLSEAEKQMSTKKLINECKHSSQKGHVAAVDSLDGYIMPCNNTIARKN